MEKKTLQTLVVTTNQTDFGLLERMNLQTDALVGNQNGRDRVDRLAFRGHTVQFVSSSTQGVGRNRNELLMRAQAELCVLADDDQRFVDGYEAIVQEWFARLPKADVLIFNLLGGKPRPSFSKVTRIGYWNYAKYGAARLAFRTAPVWFRGIFFPVLFGGGCPYGSGEDTLFLQECLKKGLRIYGVPAAIAQISDEHSTWFQGYDDRFFLDKGVLFAALHPRLSKPYALLHCLRHGTSYREYGRRRAYRQMKKGMKSARCIR